METGVVGVGSEKSRAVETRRQGDANYIFYIKI